MSTLFMRRVMHEEIPLGNDEVLIEAKQLESYFQGDRREFSLPLKNFGTVFQRALYETLSTIPYGQHFTYKEMDEKVGSPESFRIAD